MPVFTGKDVVAKIGSTPVALTQLGSIDLDWNVETIDTTALGDTGKTNIDSFQDHTLTMELHLDSTITEHDAILTPGTSFDWEGYFEGETTGQMKLSSTSRVQSVKIGARVGEKVTATVTAIQNSASGITKDTVA